MFCHTLNVNSKNQMLLWRSMHVSIFCHLGMVGSSCTRPIYTIWPEETSDTTSLHTSICSTSLQVFTHPAFLISYLFFLPLSVKSCCTQHWSCLFFCLLIHLHGVGSGNIKDDASISFHWNRLQVEPVAWPGSIPSTAHPALGSIMVISLRSGLLLVPAHCHFCLFQ